MIKGLSDRIKIARLGKIHLGEKKKSQKSDNLYPSATDYFVVHADTNTPKEIADKFHKIYGDRPKELNISFPLDDPEKFFPQWLKRYAGNTLVCKGDGEKAIETDPKTGERKEIQCLYKNCPYYQKKQCREIGNLQFYVTEIPGGVFQIDTSSYNSILEVNTAIKLIKNENNGHIANIPLKLTLRPAQVTVNGYPKTIYVLNLYKPLQKVDIRSEKKTVKEFDVSKLPDTDNVSNNDDDNILPDSDDLPEDLFPITVDENDEFTDLPDFEPVDDIEDPFIEVATDTAKYGQLKVMVIKTLKKSDTNETFHFLACADTKGEKHTLMSDDEAVKQLEGKTLIEYQLEPTDKHFEKLVSYKVLETVQEA
ncbi:MAG: FHA domain-containing protein [Thermoanaerobacterium thermosaccharolyticum]